MVIFEVYRLDKVMSVNTVQWDLGMKTVHFAIKSSCYYRALLYSG